MSLTTELTSQWSRKTGNRYLAGTNAVRNCGETAGSAIIDTVAGRALAEATFEQKFKVESHKKNGGIVSN